MNKQNLTPWLAVIGAAVAGLRLISDEREVAAAARQWNRDRNLASLLHLVTSGVFLAEEIVALG